MTDLQNFQNPQKAEKIAPVFTAFESHVAGRIGISRDHIRALRQRHLLEGEDWTIRKKKVVLTEEAVKKIAALKDLPLPCPPAGAQAEDTTEDERLSPSETRPLERAIPAHLRLLPVPRECVKSLIAWHRCTNLQILEAYIAGTDPNDRRNIMRVRVHSNLNFVQGMELPVEHLSLDLFQITRPCPRSRGRW